MRLRRCRLSQIDGQTSDLVLESKFTSGCSEGKLCLGRDLRLLWQWAAVGRLAPSNASTQRFAVSTIANEAKYRNGVVTPKGILVRKPRWDVTAKGVVEVDEELEPPPGARGLTPLGVRASYP